MDCFRKGATSKLARRTIRVQHDWLYKNAACRDATGQVSDGPALLALLKNGRLPNGFVLFFTYVIVDNIWRFSETGKGVLKDFMSKHATHAACREAVTYSGEFHFQPTPHGTYKLVLDNNSGTYAPSKEALPTLVGLFQKNFPGLEVEALDFNDPRLKEYAKHVEYLNSQVTPPRAPR